MELFRDNLFQMKLYKCKKCGMKMPENSKHLHPKYCKFKKPTKNG